MQPGRMRPAALLLALCLGLAGCGRLRPKPAETYVYVTARQAFLRDRVAAVSNRTGTVVVGQRLQVLESTRQRSNPWIKVRTEKGEIGWLQKKDTADQALAQQFEALAAKHARDPIVGSATVRDEVVLHVEPGRKSEYFYRLAEGEALNLLERAAVVKPATPGAAPAQAKPGEPPPGPVYEDWWLVRDRKGQTGWIYSHMMDVTEPDALARYAEGQRIVGAYVLAYADDPGSGMLDGGSPVTRIPEYVTVLSPYKVGLPYDFDQVRVFTWNTKKHRYETAMREKNIAGYLPVVLGTSADPYSKAANAMDKLPSFTYRVLAADAPMPAPDPVNGLIQPARTLSKTYRLVGNTIQRVVAPGPQPAEAHPEPQVEKKPAAKAKGKAKR
jgi:SH3-like domain-containing protein